MQERKRRRCSWPQAPPCPKNADALQYHHYCQYHDHDRAGGDSDSGAKEA